MAGHETFDCSCLELTHNDVGNDLKCIECGKVFIDISPPRTPEARARLKKMDEIRVRAKKTGDYKTAREELALI